MKKILFILLVCGFIFNFYSCDEKTKEITPHQGKLGEIKEDEADNDSTTQITVHPVNATGKDAALFRHHYLKLHYHKATGASISERELNNLHKLAMKIHDTKFQVNQHKSKLITAKEMAQHFKKKAKGN